MQKCVTVVLLVLPYQNFFAMLVKYSNLSEMALNYSFFKEFFFRIWAYANVRSLLSALSLLNVMI